MVQWEYKPIASFGKVVTGKTPPKVEAKYWNGEELFVSPKDMTRGETTWIRSTASRISKAALEKFRNQVIPQSSVMFTALSFGFGKIGLASKDLLTNQQINSIVVNEENCARFVYYLLRANTRSIFAYNSGIDTPIVPKSVFEKIELRAPQRREQQKIAAILTAYDDLIENNRQRIALLEKMAEEIYREWFVRLRFPGHEHTPVHKGVPEGWEVKRIGEVVQFKSGFPFKSSTYQPDGKFGVVTIKNVHDGRFISDCSDHVPMAPSKLPKHCYLQDGDILMSLTGNVGRVCLALGDNLLLNQRVALLKPTKMQHSHYIYWAFRQKSMLTFCELISTGAAQQNLSPIKLSRQTVIYPSDKIVETFQSSVQPLMSQIAMLQKSSSLLVETRDHLLNRLISGKLRVDDLDIQFPPSMQQEAA